MPKPDLFALPIPSEDDEQAKFVRWLEDVGLKFTAIPNHTYNPHRSQQTKNRRLGLRKGFPDMVVLIQPEQSTDGQGHFLAVEMKRVRNSSTSPEQHDWIDSINRIGSDNLTAMICKGADEAIWAVSQHLHPATNISPF